MSFIEKGRSFLDDIGITNASKIYTPFTVFCLFFAIYFNAATLGKIFLSPDKEWSYAVAALESLTDKDLHQWARFFTRVAVHALIAVLIYGIGQIIATALWSAANIANTKIAAKADINSYITTEEFLENRKETLEYKKSTYKISVELRNTEKNTEKKFRII